MELTTSTPIAQDGISRDGGDAPLPEPPQSVADDGKGSDDNVTPGASEAEVTSGNNQKSEAQGEKEVWALAGGKRDREEGKLRNLFVSEAGSNLDQELLKIYESGRDLSLGLHVVVGPLAFVLAQIIGCASTSRDAKFTLRGKQLVDSPAERLSTLPKRYRGERLLVVVLDEQAKENTPFWAKNQNLDAVDQAARAEDMTLVLTCSQRLFAKLDLSADLLEGLRKFNLALDPKSSDAFKLLLASCGPPGAEEMVLENGLDEGSDLFMSALGALSNNDREALIQTLNAAGDGALDAQWRQVFSRVVGERSREPAAASALYLGAHFPGMSRSDFRVLWEKLRLCAAHYWTPPVFSEDDSDPPRRWRDDDGFDDALREIGLLMKSAQDGVRRSSFSSSIAAEHFVGYLATEASDLDEALFKGLVSVGQPLLHKEEILEPFANLLARYIRDIYGNDGDPACVAEVICSLIRHHRADRVAGLRVLQREFQAEYVSIDELDRMMEQLISDTLTALQRDDHILNVAPEFIFRTIWSYRPGSDSEDRLKDIRALWGEAMIYLRKSGEDEVRFWRQMISGALFRVNPRRAVGVLGEEFNNDPRVIMRLGEDASRGLGPDALKVAIGTTAAAMNDAKGIELAWNVLAHAALLALWMHASANVTEPTDNLLSGDDLIGAIAPTLFSREGIELMSHLPEMMLYLAKKTQVKVDTMHFDGTINRQIVTAFLRMHYGLKGKEFNAFTAEIDGMRTANFWDERRWSKSATDTFPNFGAWSRATAAGIGAAILAKEIDLSHADPSERINFVLGCVPDPSLARRIMARAWKFQRHDLEKAWAAIGRKTARETDMLRMKELLSTLESTVNSL